MNKTYTLTDRAILAISGETVHEFLQGAITQDIQKIDKNNAIYTCHLTPQGRLLFDFFIYQSTEQNTVWIDIAKPNLMPLAKSLHSYSLGHDITFEDLSQTHHILAHTEQKTGWQDPRIEALGYREVTTQKPENAQERYNTHRLSLHVPDMCYDMPEKAPLPAEFGLHQLHGVSFTKGCYVGQEVTNRFHRKTTPKKKLYVVHFKSSDHPNPSPILENGRNVGTLFSNQSGYGLAFLPVRKAENAELTINDDPITKISLPAYIQS